MAEFDRQIESLFATLPDAFLLATLPIAGS
jgi:hypothetical protein